MPHRRVLVVDDEPRILDIVLVGESGYDVAGKLKKVKSAEAMPVLFMSSKVEMADLFLENFDGRAEFLLKPFKKEALLETVRTLIDGGGREAHRRPERARKK